MDDKTTTLKDTPSFEEMAVAELLEMHPLTITVSILGPKRLEVKAKHDCRLDGKFRGMKFALRFHCDNKWHGTVSCFDGTHYVNPFGDKSIETCYATTLRYLKTIR